MPGGRFTDSAVSIQLAAHGINTEPATKPADVPALADRGTTGTAAAAAADPDDQDEELPEPLTNSQKRKLRRLERMEQPHIATIAALEAQLSERNGQIKFIANTAMACKAARTTRSDTGSVTDDDEDCGVLTQFTTVVEKSATFMQLSPDSKVISRAQMIEELRIKKLPAKVACEKSIPLSPTSNPIAKTDAHAAVIVPSVRSGTAAGVPTSARNLMDFEVEEEVEPKQSKRSKRKVVEITTGVIAELSAALGKCKDRPTEIPKFSPAFKRAAQSSADRLYDAVTKEEGFEMQLEGMLDGKWGIKLTTRDIRAWILTVLLTLHNNKVPLSLSEPTSKAGAGSPATGTNAEKPSAANTAKTRSRTKKK